MKEKNKKVLKTLGVGALCLCGALTFAGCSNIEISQEKVDSMVETVEKTDSRLDEYIDLLEQQNANLEKLLEEANKMTKEDVWNLAQTADYNLMMNVDGLRDNLIVTGVREDLGLQQDLMYYYNTSDTKIFAELNGDEECVITGVELWYQTSESNVILADINKTETDYVCGSIEERDESFVFENCIGVYSGGCPGINGFGLTYDDLSHYQILENGNIKLTFAKNDTYYQNEEQTEYVTALEVYSYEYSLEGKLVSFEINSKTIDYSESVMENMPGLIEELNMEIKYVLTYNAVDVELIESWVELAETKRNAQ